VAAHAESGVIMMAMEPGRYLRRWAIGVSLLQGASGVAAAPAQPPPKTVVEWARSADWFRAGDEKPGLVLDTAAVDVPALAELLARGTEPQQMAASEALGYGSGDAAIAALRANAGAGPASSMLPLALGIRGTAADREELVSALVVKDGRWPPEGAALSLGVLRAREAVPALERLATGDGSDMSAAAHEALRWIRQGTWRVDDLPAASDEDRVIAAVFRNGIPRTEGLSLFNDDERGGAWICDGDRWRFRAGARAADAPELGFNVRFNAQRTRAILSVSVVFGPLNGSGYDYVLSREADGWKVRGVIPTWVS